MKTLTVKLPDAAFAEITAEARARNVTRSEIVRERIAAANGKRKRASLWAAMEDLVIDSAALPRDLSANKRYLQGYGGNRAHR